MEELNTAFWGISLLSLIVSLTGLAVLITNCKRIQVLEAVPKKRTIAVKPVAKKNLKKRTRVTISETKRKAIKFLVNENVPYKEIAKIKGVSYSSVSNIANEKDSPLQARLLN